jgi:outer membrane protein
MFIQHIQTMKHLFLLIVFMISVFQLNAQKFGYFDSQVVVKSLKEYQEAQKELDKAATAWKTELDKKYAQLEEKKKDYTSIELILDAFDRKQRLNEIYRLEKEVEQYRKDKFGFEGELYLKRQALIEPIQKKVFDKIESVCRKNRLEFLFDKASDIVIIYTDPIYNFTEVVIEELQPKKEVEEEEEEAFGEKEKPKPEAADYAGYIDSEYILKKMPEYQDVLNEMKNFEAIWQKQYDSLGLQLDSLNKAFKKDEVYLTAEMRDQRLKEVNTKKESVRKFQIDKYGPDGEIFTKRIDLLKPLQEKIYENAEEVALEKNVHFIFDKTGDISLFYVNPVYNYSDYILEAMELGDPEDVIR